MNRSPQLEPYEKEPGAVVIRAIFGAILGASLGGWFGGGWLALVGAIVFGWASVAYGEKFWKAYVRMRTGR